MVYNSAPHQPAGVFFNMEFGNIRSIHIGPEIPIQFSFKMTMNGTGEMTMRLYDATGREVLDALWESRTTSGLRGGTIQWGYLNGERSPIYEFQVSDVVPTYVGNAMTVTISATAPKLDPFISNNQMSGTVGEILEQFCQKQGLNLQVSPPLGPSYMQAVGYNDNRSTDRTEMRHHKWTDESDVAYIERVVQWARDNDGNGSYLWHIGHDDNGEPTLFITRAQNNRSADLTYYVQDENSVVVEPGWQPEISFQNVLFGANDVQHNSYQTLTGDEDKKVMQQQNTAQFQGNGVAPDDLSKIKSTPEHDDADDLQYNCADKMPDSVTGSAIRIRSGASSNPDAGLNPALNEHIRYWQACQGGSLTILGDPQFKVVSENGPTIVEVIQYDPINYQTLGDGYTINFTSGKYFVTEVEHLIGPGEYLCNLRLEGRLPLGS